MTRFFVKVFAQDRHSLLRLQKYDYDLFHQSAKQTKDKAASIEGLLTMPEVERLVLDGYRVLIEDEASKRSRAKEILTFEQWREERAK